MTAAEKNREIYNRISRLSSRMITRHYSTSFSLSIKFLDKPVRDAVYSIYGFVRLGDEIVDTFYDHDADDILKEFKSDTYHALDRKISLNPVLHNFQLTVHRYGIDRELIEAFFSSMEMDLHKNQFDRKNFDEYIYGSAEVVGLICLNVFCNGDTEKYDELKSCAVRLGAAFQKVNFLRDIRQDNRELRRNYFPQLREGFLDDKTKAMIENEIVSDFEAAYEGICKLPSNARLGVNVAYIYYRYLLKKIRKSSHEEILSKRIRVSNGMKICLLLKAMIQDKFNLM